MKMAISRMPVVRLGSSWNHFLVCANLRVITSLVFSPEGGRLASGSWDNTVRFWDGRDGGPIGTLDHSFPSALKSVAFSSSLLAAATGDAITLFNRETLCLVHSFGQGSNFLSFSLDSFLLASAYNDYSSSTSNVTVLAVDGHTLIAKFHLDNH
jgi:WD40 repeat protein